MKRTTFINKYADSVNVGQSTHEERRLINERNREYRKTQPAKKSVPKRQHHDTKSAKPCPGYTQIILTVKSLGADVPSISDVPARSGENSLPATTGETPPSSSTSRSVALQVLRNPGNSIDPFHANIISPSETVIQLFRYYNYVYYDYLWIQVDLALDGHLAAYGLDQCPPGQVIFDCMQNQARMNTLLANLGCQVKYRAKSSSEINADELIQNALEAFREEFRNKPRVDGGMVCNAIHLYLAVSAINQAEAANAHLKGLRAILQRLVDQGDRIIKPKAALVALVDVDLAKRLLRDPTRVRERVPKLLEPMDIVRLEGSGFPVDAGVQVAV